MDRISQSEAALRVWSASAESTELVLVPTSLLKEIFDKLDSAIIERDESRREHLRTQEQLNAVRRSITEWCVRRSITEWCLRGNASA